MSLPSFGNTSGSGGDGYLFPRERNLLLQRLSNAKCFKKKHLLGY